jgi:hypothetical protein
MVHEPSTRMRTWVFIFARVGFDVDIRRIAAV